MWAILVVTAFVGGVSAERSLGTREARSVLAKLTGTNYPEKQIHIRRILPGFVPSEAIVEADIETVIKFKRVNGDWQADEIRLGDQKWEPLQDVTQAFLRVRQERTRADLHALAAGLKAYREKNGGYVETTDIVKLTDALVPNYCVKVIRLDGWNHSLFYDGHRNSFRLASFGPDGKPNTEDDIKLSNED
ncbi:MAG: type II secretion system protein GspG [Blastocatellia bacterium]|nr:type II secretion system protein GspG [Blastocatellia bacterium]